MSGKYNRLLQHVNWLHWRKKASFEICGYSNSLPSSCLSRLVLVRREKLVSTHMTRLHARPRLLEVDPDCLRWTPVIVANPVVSDEDGDEDEDEEEDGEKENNKNVSSDNSPFFKPVIFCVTWVELT